MPGDALRELLKGAFGAFFMNRAAKGIGRKAVSAALPGFVPATRHSHTNSHTNSIR
jgi:hypothetical protein